MGGRRDMKHVKTLLSKSHLYIFSLLSILMNLTSPFSYRSFFALGKSSAILASALLSTLFSIARISHLFTSRSTAVVSVLQFMWNNLVGGYSTASYALNSNSLWRSASAKHLFENLSTPKLPSCISLPVTETQDVRRH